MKSSVIGVNFPKATSPLNVSSALADIERCGFDCAELTMTTFPLIIGGDVSWTYVNYLKSILSQHNLIYTAHIGSGLNLRKLDEHDLHRNVLRSTLDVCDALDMRLLTVHFEEASRILAEEAAFMDAHAEMANYAKSKGILLCIENIEVEHHTRVIDMIRQIDHDHFKMTLDIGHLNLSTAYFGGSFETAVAECAPYVRHIHLSDNTGRFEKMRLTNFPLYKTLNMNMRISLGYGDIHIPPFWGKIPIRQTLQTLQNDGYDGIYLCEYENSLYAPFNQEIQACVRTAVETARQGVTK
ncbi:MAG: sugar phosphate isomerase/epimerase family protein [Bacillota bacterium]|nr:sugar phosphate isomerase/epimerase family protein [Bacillota bacterium]